MDIFLYSDDVILLERWKKALDSRCRLVYDYEELLKVENSIIIINDSAFIGDIKEEIKFFKSKSNRVLVLHHNPTLKNAKDLLKLGAKGYGCIMMKEHFIHSAVESIKDGMVWLHSEFTSMLLNENSVEQDSVNHLNLKLLTSREKEVVLLLKDGFTYKDISEKLQITPRTVKAHAQNIYAKLNIKDRFELLQLFK